ncbi:MAG: response regulator [Chloroflexi bacterium]|nr:MAG: response regulator [Chloroflexota bacterium]
MSISLKEAYIIVVEDDPNAQLVALDLLRLGGANRCYSRKSVDAALAFAERLPRVDLFLVDINMPGKSGYDLLRAVRAHDKLKQAKVVAVTAATLPEDVENARQYDFDGFISKPLKMSAFAGQVQDILNGEPVWDWR